jgi:hypothetical protein
MKTLEFLESMPYQIKIKCEVGIGAVVPINTFKTTKCDSNQKNQQDKKVENTNSLISQVDSLINSRRMNSR